MLSRQMIVDSVHPRLAGGRGVLAFLIVFCLTGACPHLRNPLPARAVRGQSLTGWAPPTAQSAPKERPAGSDLFAQSCVRCHGKDGKGTEARGDTPAIPDFTNHKWQEQRSDAQLLTSILDGKGKEMPAFNDKIGREKAQGLVEYLRQFDREKSKPAPSPQKAPLKQASQADQEPLGPEIAPKVPAASITAKPQAGKALFQQRCARCHDTDGVGKEARAATPAIPDFTRHPWHEGRSDVELRVSILNGKGKLMPAFGDKIGPDQAQDLVAYLRQFDPASTPTTPASESSFEKRFQELEKEMEALRKQFRDLEAPPKKGLESRPLSAVKNVGPSSRQSLTP